MLKSSILALLLHSIAAILWLAFNIIVARITTTETFATVFFTITFAQFGALAALLGYNVVMLRHASVHWGIGEKSRISNLISESRWIIIGTSISISAILSLLHWLGVNSVVTADCVSILFATILSFLVALMTLHMEALRATGHLLKALAGMSLVRTVGSLVLLAPLIVLNIESTYTILTVHLLALTVAVGLEVFWLQRITGGGLKLPRTAPRLKEALAIWPGEVSVVLIARATVLVLGFGNDVASVALLIAADRIAMLGQFLSNAVRLAIGPAISVAHHKGGDRFHRAVQQASALMFATGFVGGLGLIIVGWPILWAFGPEYTTAFPYAVAMLAAQASWTILGPTALIANMVGLGPTRSRLTAATAISMILVQFLLLKPFGVWGVLGTFVIATWTMNALLWFEIYRKTGVRCGIFSFSAGELFSLLREDFRSLLKGSRK